MTAKTADFDDPAFLARLRQGEDAAYRALIRRFHSSLVRSAAAIIGSQAQAEEVVQDAWLAVFEGIDRFEGRSSLVTWVFSIVLNRARTRIARESRTVGLPSIMTGTPADEPAVPASAFVADGHWAESPGLWDEISPERVIAGRQLWDYVLEAIEALPAGQKAVITLRDIEARDADTVCALLDVSAENQRVLLHRARSRVRAVIDRLQRAPTRGGGSGGTTRRGASLARLIAAGMRARARVWARVWARAWVIGFPALRQA